MRIFYDCEFIDDGRTIDLVSIGMCADDTAEYYAVSSEINWRKFAANPWLVSNVWPHLPQIRGDARMQILSSFTYRHLTSRAGQLRRLFDYTAPVVKPRAQIAAEVAGFIRSFPDPALWAWYGAYDHVSLAQLFGPMAKLPAGIPIYTRDLKQECDRLGNPRLPEQDDAEHDALADARHNRVRAHFLDEVAANDWQAR